MKRAQMTLAGTGFEKYTKTARRAQFLTEMDRVVPWRDFGPIVCPRHGRVLPRSVRRRVRWQSRSISLAEQ